MLRPPNAIPISLNMREPSDRQAYPFAWRRAMSAI